MLNHYKVELTTTNSYVYDVTANTQEEAETLGREYYQESLELGTYHYHETGDEQLNTTVYDVTGTDDAPNTNE